MRLLIIYFFSDAHVMLGFSDFFFDSYNAIGKMGNAVGWVDPKQICFTTPTSQVEPLVQKTGDIFGCGIMMDSYNTNRIFITKNGKWIGFITDLFMRKVHDGMDCFPTISFLGSATVSYNFGASKFIWDAKNAPKFQRTNGINAVPAEVLSIILEVSIDIILSLHIVMIIYCYISTDYEYCYLFTALIVIIFLARVRV